MIQLASLSLSYQPCSDLAQRFRDRVGKLTGRTRLIAIMAMARKLLMALWRYAENGVTALALPFAETKPCKAEISRHVEKDAHAVLVMDRAGWHTTANLGMPKNLTAIFLPLALPGTEPGRKRLAISAAELAPKPRLRRLRRHHRRRLRGLAEAPRCARNHHINRNAAVGARRTDSMTLGIITRFQQILYITFETENGGQWY